MIHDIELVPPLASVCRGLPAGVIPVHRADSVIHFMDLRGGCANPCRSSRCCPRIATPTSRPSCATSVVPSRDAVGEPS